jgi:hypothetical protein
MMTRLAISVIDFYMTGKTPALQVRPPEEIAKEARDIRELERMYSAPTSTEPPAEEVSQTKKKSHN